VKQAIKPLAPGYYCNPEVFKQEQTQIFGRHWWLIAASHELDQPGDYVGRKVGNYPVFIIRDDNGELHGFHNTCRHRAGPMVTDGHGSCPGKLLVCQYHGWSYDFRGHLKNAHSLNSAINKADYSLYPIRVATWNGLVFACADSEATELIEWLGDIPQIAARFPATDQLSPHGTIEKKGRTNWKCYADNSCEGYHVGLVHRSLGSTTNSDQIELKTFSNGRFVGFDVTYSASVEDPTRQGAGYWIYKYPGLLLHFSEFSFNAECVMPESAGEIALKRWFWINRNQAQRRGVTADSLVQSARTVIQEDLQICERVYENLAAEIYQPGVLSVADEPGTIFFQSLVREDYRAGKIDK